MARQSAAQPRYKGHTVLEWLQGVKAKNLTEFDAARALVKVTAKAKAAVPDVLPYLNERSPDLRSLAAQVLGRIGKAARPALAKLARLLSDRDEWVPGEAAEALARIGPTIDEVPALRKALCHKWVYVARWAAAALGKAGSQALAAVNDLIAALKKDEELAIGAAEALGRIGATEPKVIRALAAVLNYDCRPARRSAEKALTRLGTPAALKALERH